MKSPVTQIQSDIIKLVKMMQTMSIHEPDFLKQSTNRKLKAIYKKYKIRAKNQIFLTLEKDSSMAITSLKDRLFEGVPTGEDQIDARDFNGIGFEKE